MSRVPRIQVDDAVYYVMPAGNYNELIFRNEEDYALYLELLAKYKNKHEFDLYAFCLAPNSISLLIAPSNKATISQIMHDLNPNYTKYFNSKYNRAGRLFQERYRMVLVEKEPNLLKMTAYIHLKPKLMRLTDNINNYKHTSFLTYLNSGLGNPGIEILNGAQSDKPDMAHEVAHVLGYLNNKSYRQFVDEMKADEVVRLDKALEKEKVIGSEKFRKEVWSKIESEKESVAEAAVPAPAEKIHVQPQPVVIEKPPVPPQAVPAERPIVQPQPARIEKQPDPSQFILVDKPPVAPKPLEAEKPAVQLKPAPIEKPPVPPQAVPAERPVVQPQPARIEKQPEPSQFILVDKPPVAPKPSEAKKPAVQPKPAPIEKPAVKSQPAPIEKPAVGPKPAKPEKAYIYPQPTPTQVPKAPIRPASNVIWIFAIIAYLVVLFFAISVFFAYTNIQKMKESAQQDIAAKEAELESRLNEEVTKTSKNMKASYETKLASYKAAVDLLEAGKKMTENDLRKAKDDLRKTKDDLQKTEDNLQKADNGWQKAENERLKAEEELSKVRLSLQPNNNSPE
jgi:putative transposase